MGMLHSPSACTHLTLADQALYVEHMGCTSVLLLPIQNLASMSYHSQSVYKPLCSHTPLLTCRNHACGQLMQHVHGMLSCALISCILD